MEKKPTPSLIHAAAVMAIAVSMPMFSGISRAQENADYSSLAQREMLRRQAAVADADRLLAEGREAYASGDFQAASDKYQQAMQKVPTAPMFADRRESYAAHLGDANLSLAMVYREQGRYDDARALLEAVLEVSPEHKLAKAELMKLEDATYSNPALTYDHTKNVEKVNRLLEVAEGQFDLGKYDAAKKEYENILRIDAYNITARRGLERVTAIKTDYYRAAYDHARAELLMQVDEAWELQVPKDAPDLASGQNKREGQDTGVAYITEKLRRIIIPRIDFEDTTVEEAISFLRQRAAELDTLELDPAKKGINFVVRRPRGAAATATGGADAALVGETPTVAANDPNALRIPELRVRNVPLAVALKYICDATKLRYKVDDYSVALVPQTETGEDFFTRSYTVPPDFQSKLGGDTAGGGGAAEADPFAEAGASKPNLIPVRPPIAELLKRSGISFPDGASATLSGSSLLVTNTPTELDRIEVLVETHTQGQPKQVKITTKFVEITQENSDELGFDWVVGPFYSGDGDMAGAGGTPGTGGSRTGLGFSGPSIPGVPAGDTQATNLLTSGNRSGNYAIAGNSIDAILNNTNRATQQTRVAPGIMSFTGLFSDAQIKVMMRGLAQKKGIDLMTAPSITARSGEKATIEIIREFIYPTEYDPPQLPGGGGGGGGGGGAAIVVPRIVTPANPTAFETRNTGVTLEIEPTLADNNFMIDLRFVPEIVEFEGFINYGSPILTPGTDALGNPVSIVLTDNRIEMPIFATRRVNTALTIYDGYTVAIGGLLREDVQNVDDRVPILGDIPWVGRLFQTKAEQRIKSNLVIFVTAQIIDPTGRPLRGGDESDRASTEVSADVADLPIAN